MTFSVGDLRYREYPGPYEVTRITTLTGSRPVLCSYEHAFYAHMCDLVNEHGLYEPEDWS